MAKKCDDDTKIDHPSAEHRCFHPADILLRRNGYKIHSRPRKGPVLWQLGDKVVTQDEAVQMCDEQGE